MPFPAWESIDAPRCNNDRIRNLWHWRSETGFGVEAFRASFRLVRAVAFAICVVTIIRYPWQTCLVNGLLIFKWSTPKRIDSDLSGEESQNKFNSSFPHGPMKWPSTRPFLVGVRAEF